MRSVTFTALLLFLSASTAAAEEIPLPFAPPVPSVFLVEESRTFRPDGEAETSGRSTARLEFRRHQGDAESFQVVWTVLSAEGKGFPGVADPAHLVGFPISLSLGARGAPNGVDDLDSIRRHLDDMLYAVEEDEGAVVELPLALRAAEAPASAVALALVPALASMSSCQGTNLRIGIPTQTEQERSLEGGYLSFRRLTWELRSVDDERASVVFTSLSEVRGGPDSELSGADHSNTGSTTRLECSIDRQSGVVRNATYLVGPVDGVQRWFAQVQFTMTPQ